MTLKQLMYFEVLAKTEHFLQAAEQLNVSQPVLSRAISGLEDELGIPLFERRGRNVVLSRYGRVFAEHITNAMREIRTGVDKVRFITDPERGLIDISVNFALANLFLPGKLKEYRELEKGAGAVFQFHQSNTPQILTELVNGVSEIGLCSYLEGWEGIRFTPIVRYPLAFLTYEGGPLAGRRSVALREIGGDPLIFSVDRTHYMEKLLLSCGIEPRVVCRMGEDRSIANLVASGMGSTILPYDPQLNLSGTVWIPIEDDCAYRDFYLATCKGRSLSPHAGNFVRFLLESREDLDGTENKGL